MAEMNTGVSESNPSKSRRQSKARSVSSGLSFGTFLNVQHLALGLLVIPVFGNTRQVRHSLSHGPHAEYV